MTIVNCLMKWHIPIYSGGKNNNWEAALNAIGR